MITVLIPCYNEEQNIKIIVERLEENFLEFKSIFNEEFSILIVDYGSTDNTFKILKEFEFSNLNYISLSRNFVKEIAITAGLNNMTENYRYIKGIYSYVGFKTTFIEYKAN